MVFTCSDQLITSRYQHLADFYFRIESPIMNLKYLTSHMNSSVPACSYSHTDTECDCLHPNLPSKLEFGIGQNVSQW